MARPSKAVDVLENEKKSHRTKAELAKRRTEEEALLTRIKMREAKDVKADPIAHAEFSRVKKLLLAVGKFDALYEAVINDYCRLESDIARCRRLREEIEADESIKGSERYELLDSYDRKIEKFRKQRRDIEKENGMTIASSARAIPKTVSKQPSALEAILSGGDS